MHYPFCDFGNIVTMPNTTFRPQTIRAPRNVSGNWASPQSIPSLEICVSPSDAGRRNKQSLLSKPYPDVSCLR